MMKGMSLAEEVDHEIDKYIKYNTAEKYRDRDLSFKKLESLLGGLIYRECGKGFYDDFTTTEYVAQDLRIELWNAIHKFDKSKKVKFSTYFCNIIQRYRKDTFICKDNICKGIYVFYPIHKKYSNTTSYNEWVSILDKDDYSYTESILTDDSADLELNRVNICEFIKTIPDINETDEAILMCIVSDSAAVYASSTGAIHVNYAYITSKLCIDKAVVTRRLTRMRGNTVLRSLLGEVYIQIEDISSQSTLDDIIIDELNSLDEIINIIKR